MKTYAVRLFALLPLACSITVDVPAAVPTEAERMQDAALALLDAVGDEKRAAMTFPWDDAARFRWSNLPASMVEPDGIKMVDLDDSQRSAVYRLLAASMSSQGYAKVAGIIRSDDLLRDALAPEVVADPATDDEKFFALLANGYYSGNFAVAIYGDPSGRTWGWQIDGHHVGVNFTVVDDAIGFTPLFLGSNPMRVRSGPYAGWMPLPLEGSLGLDLVNSLSADQRAIAVVDGAAPDDVLSGPGRMDSLAEYEGIKAERLTVSQMRLLRSLVAEYVMNGSTGADLIEAIDDADWEELRFSWRGPTDRDAVFYYRVHGPRVLIEYNRQDANHEHTLLRDPVNDFGADWLGRHFSESHPTLDEVNESFRRRAGITSND